MFKPNSWLCLARPTWIAISTLIVEHWHRRYNRLKWTKTLGNLSGFENKALQALKDNLTSFRDRSIKAVNSFSKRASWLSIILFLRNFPKFFPPSLKLFSWHWLLTREGNVLVFFEKKIILFNFVTFKSYTLQLFKNTFRLNFNLHRNFY